MEENVIDGKQKVVEKLTDIKVKFESNVSEIISPLNWIDSFSSAAITALTTIKCHQHLRQINTVKQAIEKHITALQNINNDKPKALICNHSILSLVAYFSIAMEDLFRHYLEYLLDKKNTNIELKR